MAGHLEVGEHCGAQRQAETPSVVATDPASAPVVGQQKALAMQRLRKLQSASAMRAFNEHTPWQVCVTHFGHNGPPLPRRKRISTSSARWYRIVSTYR